MPKDSKSEQTQQLYLLGNLTMKDSIARTKQQFYKKKFRILKAVQSQILIMSPTTSKQTKSLSVSPHGICRPIN